MHLLSKKLEILPLVQTFKNGKENGLFEVHYPDGKLQIKGNYKDDKKDGIWEYYHEDETLERKVTYKNDETNGKYEAFLKIKKHYILTELMLIEKEYYMNRKL